MKFFRRLFIVAFILLITLQGCSQVSAPIGDAELLTYAVSGSETALRADITYMDNNNELIKLQDQIFPWTVTIDLKNSAFINNAYIKAEIPQSEVFVSYLSGTTDVFFEKNKLHDVDADFVGSGTAPGDYVYTDPATLQYTTVVSIEDFDSLILNSDLFDAINMPYYIYKRKTLTASIEYNGMVQKQDSDEGERNLSTLVQTSIDR